MKTKKKRLPLRRLRNESNENYVKRYVRYTLDEICKNYEEKLSKRYIKKRIKQLFVNVYNNKLQHFKVKIVGNSIMCSGELVVTIPTISMEVNIENANSNKKSKKHTN